jgi:outer membrane protein assembly factor BamB
VITSATRRVRSYDLDSGELIWECGGQTTNAIPSPVTTDGLAICMTGFQGNAVYAIPLDSSGDLTETSDKLAWHYNGKTDYRPDTPYVPSPLLYGDLLYYLKGNTAVLSCVVAKTGEVQFDQKRLTGLRGVYASPVGAAGRVYIVGRDGTTAVVKHGKEFEEIATNKLDEPIDASPAVVGNEIFLRGHTSLYCIARP